MEPGAFNYSEDGSLRNIVRLLIGDTSQDAASFSDAQIDRFLTLCANNVAQAGALAFESWARGRTKASLLYRDGEVQSTREGTKALLDAAKALRTAPMGTAAGMQAVKVGSITADGDYYANVRPLGSIKQDSLKEV